jgi:molybdopterin-containing oxidoreductase family iron-sulfur binding subunit
MPSLNQLDSNRGTVQWPPIDDCDDIRELFVRLENEFPQAAAEFSDGISRRRWLQLMGASLALTGAAGCRYQVEKIAPFAFRPADRHPGTYVRYATAIDLDGVALPLLVNTIDGRPIKVDGNPDHPDSAGASDIFSQARILDLYDPDRSQSPSTKSGNGRTTATWAEFDAAIESIMAGAAGNQGGSLAILSQPNSSPSLARLRQRLLEKYPNARWFEYSAIGNDNELKGCEKAFGQPLRPHYALAQCRIVVGIDADPLSLGGAAVRFNREFAQCRDPDKDWMSRVYAIESQFSLLSASADHRLALAPKQIPSFVAALETALGASPADPAAISDPHEKVLAALVQDLLAHKGASAVICGWSQPPEVQAAVWRINQVLGNLGTTITFSPAAARPTYVEQIKELVAAMHGYIKSLIILDGNPVYDAPADLKFADALRNVNNSVYFGLTENETSRECGWFGNAAHPLEAWGDGISHDGTHCIAQPMIAPLYGARSTLEFVAALAGEPVGGLDTVRTTAALRLPTGEPDLKWTEAVERGFVLDSSPAPVAAALADSQRLTPTADWKSSWDGGKLELIFTPSRQLFDGRFSNSGWLQELPDFITKLTWDNAAILSPKTARLSQLRQGEIVRIDLDGKSLTLPVHIQPGHANGTVTVALGYGRSHVGRVGGDSERGIPTVGADIGQLRLGDSMYTRSDVSLVSTNRTAQLALSQDPFTLDKMGRDGIRDRLGPKSPIIRGGNFAEFRRFVHEHGPLVDAAELKTEHDPDWTPHRATEHGASGHDPRRLPVLNASVALGNGVAQEHGTTPDRGATQHAGEQAHDAGGHHDPRWPSGLSPHFENLSLTPGPKYSAVNKWGLSIDLTKCTGCNACIIGCQAENNIPIVGKDQVIRGREMHWIRIDGYVLDDPGSDPDADNIEFKFQPLMCQHCENAPCETVCPVAATVHSNEGLNDMVYNRCIGTRYCGNNCPYKVRRFNYLNYSEAVTFIKYPNEGVYNEREKQIRGLGMNPEVTVRSRGVMEKCTYCVQRIQNTKILARNQRRPIGPNEIRTACQDACPAQAIVFGNLADPGSDVRKNHLNVRAYQLLDQLNNQPRTRYLARVRNPHPDLAQSAHADSH